MFSSTAFLQQQQRPPTLSLPVNNGSGGMGRLEGLMQAVESRVHLLGVYAYDLICSASPLPFEWTVVLVIFSFITIKQLVMWYQFDLKVETHGYVYWSMRDLIDTDFLDEYNHKNHLSTAVIVYVTQKLWREHPLTTAETKNRNFTIHLLSLHAKSIEDEMAECYSDEDLKFRDHPELMLPVKLPVFPGWTPTHEGGVEMCTWITTTRIKNSYPEAHRYVYLRLKKENTLQGGTEADAALRAFVNNALAYYFDKGYADRDDHSLRTFHVTPTRQNQIAVKAGPLQLGPTFDTVFFPQRAAVKLQLQRFTEMKDKYAVQGFPRKLGFLLYGPRGTGKRSFVRALAYHTKRHIVRIPLSQFEKNEQLFNTFYFEEATYGSSEEWKMLKSKRVIFLLEDVDTESELVCARGEDHVARVRQSRGLTTRTAEKGREVVAECDATIYSSTNTNNVDVDEAEALTSSTSHTPCTITTSTRPHTAAAHKKVAADAAAAMSDPVALGWGALFSQEDAKLDAINLSSLLNVLDGAVEDPERIVVMIADHPERLDPALLRPGRLATHVRFDFMELPDLVHLCGLFYGAECLPVTGTLYNDGTAASSKRLPASSSSSECGMCVTASDDDPLHFPHESRSGGTAGSSGAPQSAGVVDDKFLDWQQNDGPLLAMQKMEEKVIRQLSPKQAAQVHACVRALEEESAGCAHYEAHAYNFFITPAHAHHLCMRATTLDSFLDSLKLYIRNSSH